MGITPGSGEGLGEGSGVSDGESEGDGDGLTVYGRVVPYGEVATVDDGAGPYQESFERGAFSRFLETNARKVPLLDQHNRTLPVGKAVGWDDRDDGLHAKFRLSMPAAEKVAGLRLFADAEDKMNLALADVGGSLLVVSQFTLYGDSRKGRRPSFIDAARPEIAIPLYERFIQRLRETGFQVETGEFGAMMDVELVNDGPVTLWLER